MKSKTFPADVLVVDYSAARARAIRWLGDRYLLAKPINAGRHRSPGLPPTDPADSTRAAPDSELCFPE